MPDKKIACGGCDHLFQRKFCSLKQIKVSRKKLHDCELFEPKVKRPPPEPVYVPFTAKEGAKRARSFMRKLQAVGGKINPDGTISIGETIRIDTDGSVHEKQTYEIPKTTAQASVVGLSPLSSPQLTDSQASATPEDE